jgi:hypothetical protein
MATPISPSVSTSEQRRALRELQVDLAGAADGKLREIVALVDALPQRGAADNLLVPLRGRMTQLRPLRRMNLTRLLFMPIDKVIAAQSQWRRGALAIPRGTLMCLGQLIGRELGDDAPALAEAIAGLRSDDRGQILRHGRTLWPRAATILAGAAMPPDWTAATGLGAPDFLAVARPLAVVLGEAAAIEQMLLEAGRDDPAPPLRACLARALEAVARMRPPVDASLAGLCLGMLFAVLLARLPAAGPLLLATGDLAARNGDPIARLAADNAIDAAFDQTEARLAKQGGTLGAGELARIATLIDAVEQPGPASRPSRKPRAISLRRALDTHCRQRFQSDLAERLLARLPRLGAEAADAQVSEMEEAALELRRLETAGRAFGGAAHYERALAEGGQALLKQARPDARRIDLARLAEILQGPEAGLAVFDAGRR